MPNFSASSQAKLKTCDIRLQNALNVAIKHVDFTVTCGHRTKSDQDAAFASGVSKLKWPDSKHNFIPSLAVDIAPCVGGKIDWKDADRFKNVGFFILGILAAQGVNARLGGDWDRDFSTTDERFVDLPHIEVLT